MKCILSLFLLLVSTNCESKSMQDMEMQSRGRAVYSMNCIGCHNINPNKVGSVGPSLSGSSLDLITLKVVKGVYPDGYSPKRKTKYMPTFPELTKQDLKVLHAYLNSL